MKLTLIILFFYRTLLSIGQSATEIYLFNLNLSDTQIQINTPINISNNKGYDNQPSFWSDGESILYARNNGGQTDIARYIIAKDSTILITHTKGGSEYSPVLMSNQNSISCIYLDTFGIQQLVKYRLNGTVKILFSSPVIGYYTWIDKKAITAFVLGDPPTLQNLYLNGGKNTVATHIGRSLATSWDKSSYSYLDESTTTPFIIFVHIKSKKVEQKIKFPTGTLDYCLTPSGGILTGKGSELMFFGDKKWIKVSDLTQYGLKDITRLAVSPDGKKIALVVAE